MIINGIDMPRFNKRDFPENPDKYANRWLLTALNEYRRVLKAKIYPSKAKGALARFDGRTTSYHYVEVKKNCVTRESMAIDIFCKCSIFKAWTIAINCGYWGGVGVYFDTNGNDGHPWPMLHLDKRTSNLIWFRDNGEYFYPGNDGFWSFLNKLFVKYSI